jgi:hypothetical protein
LVNIFNGEINRSMLMFKSFYFTELEYPSFNWAENNKRLTVVKLQAFVLYGAPKEIRTPDPLVRSQVLYPAELWAHVLM